MQRTSDRTRRGPVAPSRFTLPAAAGTVTHRGRRTGSIVGSSVRVGASSRPPCCRRDTNDQDASLSAAAPRRAPNPPLQEHGLSLYRRARTTEGAGEPKNFSALAVDSG